MTPEEMQAEMDRLKGLSVFPQAMTQDAMQAEMERLNGLGAFPQAPQQQAAQPPQGLLARMGAGIQNLRNDPEKMARLQMGLNSMRLNPDQGIAASAAQTIQTAQEDRRVQNRANATISALQQAAATDPLAKAALDAIKANPTAYLEIFNAYAKEKIKGRKSVSQMSGENLNALPGGGVYDPSAMYNVTDGADGRSISRIGGAPSTILNMGGKAEGKFLEGYYGNQLGLIKSDFEGGEGATQTLETVTALQLLSPAIDKGVLPNALKKYVPEGISSPLDAYNSQLVALVPALRVPGSGTQTDRDAEQILSRAGSVSASLETRQIAHSALRKMAQRKYDLSVLANQFFQLGAPSETQRQQYFVDRQKILNRPIMTEKQRAQIEQLDRTGQVTFDDGSSVREIN